MNPSPAESSAEASAARFKLWIVLLTFAAVNVAVLLLVFDSRPPASAGSSPSVHGRISLVGVPPPEQPLPLDPVCAKLWKGKNPTTRFYLVGTNGGLGDVFVYVKSGLASRNFASTTNPVIMRKTGCVYVDYIVGAQTGQPITVRNTDPLLCNVHFTPTNPANREWNKAMLPRSAAATPGAQPASRVRAAWDNFCNRVALLIGRPAAAAAVAAPEITFQITGSELPARLKCDVHPWEFGYVFCVDHPFFAVTDGDGNFRFSRPLPPGKYVLEAIHRRAGSQSKEIEVDASGAARVNFEFTPR